MRRRDLLSALPFSSVLARISPLPIRAVEIWKLEGTRVAVSGVDKQHQVQPQHIYDDLRPAEYRDGDAKTVNQSTSALYLKVLAGDVIGLYGPVDKEAAIVIDQQLRGFLTGKDALAGETLWDQLHRLNRHARAGHFLMAISAVDNALWDLRGRVLGMPVYRLLGGPSRGRVPVYGSCLGYSVRPEQAAARARQLAGAGYRHQKWFLAYGPGDGASGMEKNVELVRALRDAVGENVDLMFDAFMGWDLNYALQWAKRTEQFRPRWIEEAFAPDKIESFAQLRRATSIPVASGEHIYGRWETQRYLATGALAVVQCDPEWCGGLSELLKITAIASAHDVHVIPHGHAIHAAWHFVASQSPMTCPLVEYLILKMSSFYYFEKNPPRVENGTLSLPTGNGFGIEFDDAKITKRSLLTWS